MQPDPVVAQIRETRERLAARLNDDVDAIGRDARQRKAIGDRVVVHSHNRKQTAPKSHDFGYGK